MGKYFNSATFWTVLLALLAFAVLSWLFMKYAMPSKTTGSNGGQNTDPANPGTGA